VLPTLLAMFNEALPKWDGNLPDAPRR